MDYKEKLEEAKRLYETANADQKYVLESLFPELGESEDEKIRKELIAWLQNTEGQVLPIDRYYAAVAWLEKQGEQKPFDYENANIQQKDFAPKEEPKFKVGDWILYSGDHYEGVRHITKINENGYYIERNGLPHGIIPFNHEVCMRLWTIQDAKDGDVLYCENSGIEYIVMNKGINKSNNIDSYFRYNSEDGFDIGVPSVLSAEEDIITPATKEQRDFLFKKMQEAGYEWDAEKKELKLLITNGGDFESEVCEQSSAWSKEDERLLNNMIIVIKDYYNDKDAQSLISWLKSLKPQSQWKPSDEQIEILDMVLTNESMDDNIARILREIREQLKKLREDKL